MIGDWFSNSQPIEFRIYYHGRCIEQTHIMLFFFLNRIRTAAALELNTCSLMTVISVTGYVSVLRLLALCSSLRWINDSYLNVSYAPIGGFCRPVCQTSQSIFTFCLHTLSFKKLSKSKNGID